MPTVTLRVAVRVTVSEEGANVNEILAATSEVREAFGVQLAEAVIGWLQEEVRDRLCGSGAKAPSAWGRHARSGGETGGETGGCRCRRFVKDGYRSESRRLRTDLGVIAFPLGYVQCRGCGKKFAPIRNVLEMAPRQGHALELERVVVEATNKTSFARSVAEVEGLTGLPLSKSTHHRWMAGIDLPEVETPPLEQLMADGTKYKKRGGERGELRLAIGVTPEKAVVGLGTWSGKSWSQIGKDLKRRLKGKPRVPVAIVDGETGLDQHVASLAGRTQRSQWHLLRDLRVLLWHDGLKKAEADPLQSRLAGIIGVEIPAGEWEAIAPLTREALQRRVAQARQAFQAMIEEFDRMGYRHGKEYLEGARDRIFTRVDLWLQTGIIAPTSTGLIEEIMREVGRRIKKLGWNWADHGASQQAALILLRRYSQPQWDEYWIRRLGLHNRCLMTLGAFQCN
jgi:hypothetical protein